MCSCCKMDPTDVKVMYQRQGMVEVEDFDDEVRVRHPKRRAKKPRQRTQVRTPCPHTEDGKHVYVWEGYAESWDGRETVFYRHFGFYKREYEVCCGCMVTRRYRETERYMKVKERKWRKLTGGEFDVKRGEPVGRPRRWSGTFYSFTWESYDEGFQEAFKTWEQTREAERFRNEQMMRRIEMRRKWFGLP